MLPRQITIQDFLRLKKKPLKEEQIVLIKNGVVSDLLLVWR